MGLSNKDKLTICNIISDYIAYIEDNQDSYTNFLCLLFIDLGSDMYSKEQYQCAISYIRENKPNRRIYTQIYAYPEFKKNKVSEYTTDPSWWEIVSMDDAIAVNKQKIEFLTLLLKNLQ